MDVSRVNTLRDKIARRQGASGAWADVTGAAEYSETTSLAALSLLASAREPDDGVTNDAVAGAAEWLSRLQQRDGGIGLAPALPQPRWPTPLAILVWTASGRCNAARDFAIEWLLLQRGVPITRTVDSPFAHDGAIPGWPWADGTHSRLEPTALAV